MITKRALQIGITSLGVVSAVFAMTASTKAAFSLKGGLLPITPIVTHPPLYPSPTSTPTATPEIIIVDDGTKPPGPLFTPTPTPTPTPTSTPVSKADLIITNVYPQTAPIAQNWFTLMVSVKNQGMTQSKATNIYAQITASAGSFWRITSCDNFFIPVLNPNQSATASTRCIVYNPGLAKAVVTVDYNNVVPESNEGNNTFTKYFNVL